MAYDPRALGPGPAQIPLAEMGPIGQPVGMPPPPPLQSTPIIDPSVGMDMPLPEAMPGLDPSILAGLRGPQTMGMPEEMPTIEGWEPAGPTPMMGPPDPMGDLHAGLEQMGVTPIMPSEEQPMDEQGFTGAFEDVFEPETEMRQRFEQLMGAYPEHKRGFLENLVLGLMSWNDPKLVQQYLTQPSPAQQAWFQQMKAIEPAMREERYTNRMLQRQYEQDAKLALQAKDLARKERYDEAMIKIRQMTAERTYMQPMAVPGGNLMLIDTRTGEVHDTGIESGRMSEMDKLQTQAADRLEQIEFQSDAAMERVREQLAGSMERVEAQQTGAMERAQLPGRGTARGQTPLQQRQAYFNAGLDYVKTPEGAEAARNGWIEFNQDDEMVSVTAPATEDMSSWQRRGRPSLEQWQAIQDGIAAGVDTTAGSTVPTGAAPATGTDVSPGKVRVRNIETGQTGTVSEAVLQAYPERYERIQ